MSPRCCPDCGNMAYSGRCPTCRDIARARGKAIGRMNAGIRAANRETERGNRRRRRCVERVVLCCIAKKPQQAAEWLTRLEIAGFDSGDVAWFHSLVHTGQMLKLENEFRILLGLKPKEVHEAQDGSGVPALSVAPGSDVLKGPEGQAEVAGLERHGEGSRVEAGETLPRVEEEGEREAGSGEGQG